MAKIQYGVKPDIFKYASSAAVLLEEQCALVRCSGGKHSNATGQANPVGNRCVRQYEARNDHPPQE